MVGVVLFTALYLLERSTEMWEFEDRNDYSIWDEETNRRIYHSGKDDTTVETINLNWEPQLGLDRYFFTCHDILRPAHVHISSPTPFHNTTSFSKRKRHGIAQINIFITMGPTGHTSPMTDLERTKFTIFSSSGNHLSMKILCLHSLAHLPVQFALFKLHCLSTPHVVVFFVFNWYPGLQENVALLPNLVPLYLTVKSWPSRSGNRWQ